MPVIKNQRSEHNSKTAARFAAGCIPAIEDTETFDRKVDLSYARIIV
jgi:hypothetical protein